MLIVFEGVDFTGKTTQARVLYSRLCDRLGSDNVILTREPGGTPYGERIREILKSEPNISLKTQFYLIESQRQEHMEKVLLPNIDSKTIICDRMIFSSFVYQNAVMSPHQWLDYIGKHPCNPDLTFVLYSNNLKSIAQDRRRGTPADHFDNASFEELYRKQGLFRGLAEVFPHRVINIDADRTIEEISKTIWTTVLVAYEEMK